MAKKEASVFFCRECGNETSKWSGQCPACRAWNTLEEVTIKKAAGKVQAAAGAKKVLKPVSINEVHLDEDHRLATGYEEMDRVLGGGIVKGSLVLLGGDPGIGKSTILLQVMRNLSAAGTGVLYVSGEESASQIKLRADRIGAFTDQMKLLCETNLDDIEMVIKNEKPQVVVIDSVQTMYQEEISSAPGSVAQIREATSVFLRIAKGMGITIFLIGHVTKEGAVAGPRVLEHMVDTVLYFEGEKQASYRILRGVKNRFGSTNEIGVFEMGQEGLSEVLNPSEFMLSGRPEGESGSVTSCAMEGTRAILMEIQALVSSTNFNYPKRTATGFDYNRVSLLIAVLENKLGMHLSTYDAYVNIAGGMKITEPAVDLGVALAIVSSFKNIVVDSDIMVFGEIGLSGEVRGVSQAVARVQEAAKLGYKTCIIPESNKRQAQAVKGIEIIGVRTVEDAVRALSGDYR